MHHTEFIKLCNPNACEFDKQFIYINLKVRPKFVLTASPMDMWEYIKLHKCLETLL